MKARNLLLISVCLAPIPALAQPVIGRVVSVGVTGGMGLTGAFSDQTSMGVDTDTHYFSGRKDYIVGPEVEIHLPMKLSVEFDALYRPLNLTIANTVIPSGTFTTSSTVNSWEFPVLAKYRFSMPLVKPFLEAGPSFRRVSPFFGGSPHLSRAGFTSGAGVEFRLGPLRIDPGIRYTRWDSDSNQNLSSFNPESNVNQAELLLGLSF